jgi:hypothetical protein
MEAKYHQVYFPNGCATFEANNGPTHRICTHIKNSIIMYGTQPKEALALMKKLFPGAHERMLEHVVHESFCNFINTLKPLCVEFIPSSNGLDVVAIYKESLRQGETPKLICRVGN